MKFSRFLLFSLVWLFAASTFAQTEQPYSWSVAPKEKDIHAGDLIHIIATATIKDLWHIYSTKSYGDDGPLPTQFTVEEGKYFTISGAVTYPKPLTKKDEAFDITSEYFEHNATFTVPVRISAATPVGKQTIKLKITAMACNDRMCMPPKSNEFDIPVTIEAALGNAAPAGKNESVTPVPSPSNSAQSPSVTSASGHTAEGNSTQTSSVQQSGSVDNLQSKGLLWFIGFAFSMGLLSLLTPCVFPMIPLTVSFFTKRGTIHRGEAIREASLYGAGIIGTYTAAGFLFAIIFGASSLANLATNPVVNLVFGSIFLLLALNLFGVYEIAIPARMLNSINALSSNGTSVGALMLMGLTFTFTSFTCTVPFVGTVMVAAAHGQFLWPFLGMLSYSTAFALPFILLALFPHALHRMPRSGEWMHRVKVVMGFLELAAVIKFLSNTDLIWQWKILTRDVFLSSWMAISLILVAYLLGIFRMKGETEESHIGPGRLLLSVFFLIVTLFFYTGINGIPLGTIDAYLPPREYGTEERMSVTPISAETNALQQEKSEKRQELRLKSEYVWLDNYQKALALAREQKKNIFIDFTGYTCTNCRWMESNVFPKPVVDSLLRQFVLVRLYTDGEGEAYQQNQTMEETRFGTIALPLYAIMSADDKTVAVFSQGLTRNVDEFASFLMSGLPHDMAAK